MQTQTSPFKQLGPAKPLNPLMGSSLRTLQDVELLKLLRTAIKEERKLSAQILEYLREIDRRKLYSESGHSSLWDFCVHGLGYSEASAYRRIASMNLIREMPELKDDIISGKQSLTSLSQAQRFFKQEQRHRDETIQLPEKMEVIKKLENKSTRECERELLKLATVPFDISHSQRERVLDEAFTQLTIVLNNKVLEKLKRIQALRSHAQPAMNYEELFEYMADEVLKRIDPMEKAKRQIQNAEKSVEKSKVLPPAPEVGSVENKITENYQTGIIDSKNQTGSSNSDQANRDFGDQILKPGRTGFFPRVPIAAKLRREVWLRDRGHCTFADASGTLCGSQHFLEIDHIRPVAIGGKNELSNLRVRCRTHNQLEAFKVFGKGPEDFNTEQDRKGENPN